MNQQNDETPTKLTDAVRARLIEAVAEGLSYDDAACYAGIPPGTLYRWRATARCEKKGPLADFVMHLKKARNEAVLSALKELKDIGRKSHSWQALSWFRSQRVPAKCVLALNRSIVPSSLWQYQKKF